MEENKNDQAKLPETRPPKNPPAASPEAGQNLLSCYEWFCRKLSNITSAF